MKKLTEEEEIRKKAIFDGLSSKRKEKILRKGYENWDPFAPPNDPLDMRTDQRKNTALVLARKFLATCPDKALSNAYGNGVWEMCIGIVSGSERHRGMYEFSCWYRDFIESERPEELQGK